MRFNYIKFIFIAILMAIIIVNFLNGRVIHDPQVILVTNISLVMVALFFIVLRFSKAKKR